MQEWESWNKKLEEQAWLLNTSRKELLTIDLITFDVENLPGKTVNVMYYFTESQILPTEGQKHCRRETKAQMI